RELLQACTVPLVWVKPRLLMTISQFVPDGQPPSLITPPSDKIRSHWVPVVLPTTIRKATTVPLDTTIRPTPLPLVIVPLLPTPSVPLVVTSVPPTTRTAPV